jgi:hypothetical protein
MSTNYEDWKRDPGAVRWYKSGYNPRSKYGFLVRTSEPPLDAGGWLMILFPIVAVAVAAWLGWL